METVLLLLFVVFSIFNGFYCLFLLGRSRDPIVNHLRVKLGYLNKDFHYNSN